MQRQRPSNKLGGVSAGIIKGQESPTGSDLERRGVGKQGAPEERLDDCAVNPGTLRLGDTGHEQMKRCRRAVLAFLHIPITRPLELEAIYANMEMSLQRHKQNDAMLFRHTTILVQKCKRYENRTIRNTNCEVYTFRRRNKKGCTTIKGRRYLRIRFSATRNSRPRQA